MENAPCSWSHNINCGYVPSVGVSLSKFRELVVIRAAWCAVVHGVTKSQTWLSDWTDTDDALCGTNHDDF